MQQLLAQCPQLTAVFSQNDRMAIGAIRALREAGRRIPDDMAIVGYDDIPPASYCYPPLTTVRQPMQEVGRLATKLLVEMIQEPDMDRQETLLKPYLIRRATCGGQSLVR